MRAALSQHFTHGKNRLSANLVIDGDRVDKHLDFLRRVESAQNSELASRKTEILAAGWAQGTDGGHACEGS